jgi:hypothetical protein
LVHDFCSIVGIFFGDELHKAIPLMYLADAILREMDVDNTPSLEHQLPNEVIRDALIEVTDVDSSFLVLFPVRY